eukprot:130112_1
MGNTSNKQKLNQNVQDISSDSINLQELFKLSVNGEGNTEIACRTSIDPETGLIAFEDVFKTDKIWCYDVKNNILSNRKRQLLLFGYTRSHFNADIPKDLILLFIQWINNLMGCMFFNHDIFGHKSPQSPYERGTGQTHHWVTINDQKYLMFQASKSEIKFFRVMLDEMQEESSLNLKLEDDHQICWVELDKQSQFIYLIVDYGFLEQRLMNDMSKIVTSIKLDETIHWQTFKQIALSNDGSLCIIAGGRDSNYFYIIDIGTTEQTKISTTSLRSTYGPSFINGENKQISIGGEGKVAIYDVNNKILVKTIDLFENPTIGLGRVTCTHSVNNLLAVGGHGSFLKILNIENWSVMYDEKYEIKYAYSLTISVDGQFLCFGGYGGEGCILWKIQ